MSKIAVLGLGQMGQPIATRLLQAGHHVTVWNRTAEKAAPLAARGAAVASSPAEAAAGADVVITMLATPEALEQVVLGDEGLAGAMSSGQILLDMSTVGPDAVRSIAGRLPAGVSMVDAPVRGSVAQATDGSLDVFVGAPDDDFARVRPFLESLGSVRHTGGLGSGAATKLVVNLALGAGHRGPGGVARSRRVPGLTRELVLDVLVDSPIGATVRSKRANIESGHYSPNFKLRLAAKDLRLVTDAAGSRGRDLRLARASHEWLEEAAQRGAADLDYSAVVAVIIGDEARA